MNVSALISIIMASCACHCQAPNFAFALASRKYREQRERLARYGSPGVSYDLSSVQHMINAAEPVDLTAISAFYEDFRPHGLRSEVIIPTYGLAEHTVYVCSAEPHRVTQQITNESFPTTLHPSGVRCVSVAKSTLESQGMAVPSKDDSDCRVFVSCGNPSLGENVILKIVDPNTAAELGEDRVSGSIYFSSLLSTVI